MNALQLGNRKELFTDRYLLEKTEKLSHRLGLPVSAGCVLPFHAPWEGQYVTYPTLIQAEGKAYLYYRGTVSDRDDLSDNSYEQVTCVAVTDDGIHFTRPALGLFRPDFPDNNILLHGPDSHNFAPFYDTNPDCDPARRWKAVAGEGGGDRKRGLRAYYSADGLHWEKPTDEPMITEGQFDSHNVAFFDYHAGMYRCYSRYWDENGDPTGDYVGVRAIQSSVSSDFAVWSSPVPNRYDTLPSEHFYTNATVPCPGAEHILLSFPMRFHPDRKYNPDWPAPGVSDCILMSSRDGVNWDRLRKEAFLRGGCDPLNWGDRSQIMVRGFYVRPDSSLILYMDRHYHTRSNYLEALYLRPQGFMSLHGDWDGGEALTKPLIFGKGRLHINASTGAYGHVRVQAETPEGAPIPGFEFADGWFGDAFDAIYPFGHDFSSLAGTPVRLRLRLRDAELYALWAE